MRSTTLALAIGFLLAVPAGVLGRSPVLADERPSDPQVLLAEAQFPTNMALTPDGRLLYTEKETGSVRIIEDGRLLNDPFAAIPVKGGAETGLLGIALHPDFPEEPWVYLYLSYKPSRLNRIVRARADGNTAAEVQPVMDLLPIASGYHNGGELAFGPDGKLYVTVGEAHDGARAQDPLDLGGKILRLNPDGSIPADNPFGENNPVYSLGHRNSFGLCFDSEGNLFETENGPDAHDEINEIVPGGNYGWPDVSGPGGAPGFVDPTWDFPEIIAPTGCAVEGDTLWFGDFRGDLHRSALDGVPGNEEVVATFPAGITDVMVGPGGELYVATTDSIMVLSEAPVDPVIASPAVGATEDSGGSNAPWIAAVVAAVVVLIGGLWFRSIARREEESEPPATPGA